MAIDSLDAAGMHARLSAASTLAPGNATQASEGGELAPVEELARGTEVGRYLILERIGAGAMGVVLAAYDPALDRKVALKILKGDPEGEDSQRLAREARALARLDHPNVVTVHDVGVFQSSDGSRVFIAMEFVEGVTLRRWLADPHPWEEVLAAMTAAGEGLAAAHDAGLVHRDFKPDNVMITTQGVPGKSLRVRVLDFGLARAHTEVLEATIPIDGDDTTGLAALRQTNTGGLVGTPAYMAPEQFAGARSTAASDQFSFCVALWEALLGEHPFAGDNVPALALAVSTGEIRKPKDHGVPSRIVAAIRRGLAVDAAERWPSMRALIDALQPVRSRKRWLWLAMGGTAVVAIAAVAWPRGRDPCPRSQDALAGVWDERERAAIEARVLASPLPFAANTWQLLRDRIDPWATRWLDGRVEACRATHVRHEQSEALLDRRIACLDRQRDNLAARLESLARGGDAVLASTPDLLEGLAEPDACADVDALLAEVAPPPEPERRAAVESARAQLARASAMRRLGELPAADAALTELVATAETLAYAPLVSEIAVERAELFHVMQRSDAARESAEAAVWAAHAAGDERAEAKGSIEMIELLAADRRFDEVEGWVRHAQADVARRPGDVELDSKLTTATARLAFVRDRYDEAREGFTRAHALCTADRDPLECTPLLDALAQVEHGAGNLERARTYYESVIEVELAGLGPDHPTVGMTHANLSTLLRSMGQLDEARVHVDEAIRIYSSISPDHPTLGRIYNNRAVIYLFENRFAEAERDFRSSLASMAKEMGADHPLLLGIEGNVGMTLYAQGRFADALAMHESVLARTVAVYGEDSMEVADSVANIGDVELALERWDDAAKSFARAAEIRERLGGNDHVEAARARCNLGEAQLGAGRPELAIESFQRCLAVWERVFGRETEALAHPQGGIGKAMLALGQTGHGIAKLQYALALAMRGDSENEAADLRWALGRAQWDAGRDRNAARLHVQAAHDHFAKVGGMWQRRADDSAAWLRSHP
ncbi:MAG TPA: tetratricopeptide repeat protein [Nannocystaceae bacterium]|nr:tetratricopeptide repeat protein [Nannocystaceae bacterium]